jgi:mRNA interferase RelE/StbE
MPEKIATACWEFIHGPLAENPYRVGKLLLAPLAPQYSARRGEYRVLYLIEDEQVTIVTTSISQRTSLRGLLLPHVEQRRVTEDG